MEEKRKLSRRQFLLRSAGVVGASAVVCAGGGALAMRLPAIDFANTSCGNGAQTGDKILVAYASAAGSTAEIAEAIGQVFCDNGASVDVRQVQNVANLSPYRAVILGSAIRASAWLPGAVKFVKTHRRTLSQLPVAYFLSCATLAMANIDDVREKLTGFLEPVRQQAPEVQPVDTDLFAGALDFSKLPFLCVGYGR